MNSSSICDVMSMTKPITVAVVLQLVEEGLLTLDSPASETIPWLGEVAVLGGYDVNGAPVLSAQAQPVTLRHLLMHTSGFAYPMWNDALYKFKLDNGGERGDSGRLGSGQADFRYPLVAQPGERWEYGIGIDWAGWMAEAATGEPLASLVSSRILEPLGMVDTGFDATPPFHNRRAVLYRRCNDGALALEPPELRVGQEFRTGGSGLYSTVDDYSRFLRMLLNRGELDGYRVLRPTTVELMTSGCGTSACTRPLRAFARELVTDLDPCPGMDTSWSHAWLVYNEPHPSGASTGSGMWAGLFNTYFWIDPTNGVAGVYFSQVLPFPDQPSLLAFTELQRLVYSTETLGANGPPQNSDVRKTPTRIDNAAPASTEGT